MNVARSGRDRGLWWSVLTISAWIALSAASAGAVSSDAASPSLAPSVGVSAGSLTLRQTDDVSENVAVSDDVNIQVIDPEVDQSLTEGVTVVDDVDIQVIDPAGGGDVDEGVSVLDDVDIQVIDVLPSLEGTVFETDGVTPVPGAMVTVEHIAPLGDVTSYATVSNGDGRYAMPDIGQGSVSVEAVRLLPTPALSGSALGEVQTTGVATVHVILGDGEPLPDTEGPFEVVPVAPTDGSLRGTVYGADGVTEVPGAVVTVEHTSFEGDVTSFAAATDADGAYMVDGIGEGTVTVDAVRLVPLPTASGNSAGGISATGVTTIDVILAEPDCTAGLSDTTAFELLRLEAGEITYDEFLTLIEPEDLGCIEQQPPDCVLAGTCGPGIGGTTTTTDPGDTTDLTDPTDTADPSDCGLEDLSDTTLLQLDRLNNGEISYEEFLDLADPADLECILSSAPDCLAAGDCGDDSDEPQDQKPCEVDGTCPDADPADQKPCEVDGTCPQQDQTDKKQCEIDGTCPPDQKQCEIDGTCPSDTKPGE